ncbi:hypothetical protein FE633_20285 [Streptomyces montanus]|uniref:Uncharacterized protein n=1 Tax=Streptomyces montanus TaxID=2580423 RepID=A0A5R9FP18_9ACTN|nr:hypothetical protein [Streptomyces montanus]TLS44369.1 hypothetical protein FE633_20285 [Streptomyces montanus]
MFTAAWVAWMGLFVAIEGLALYRKQPGDTLSEHVSRWFHTAKGIVPDRTTRLRRFALVAFMAWLSAHFPAGGTF